MTVVNTETGEIVERPTYGDVRKSIEAARSHGERFFEQIVWQVENEVWTVLGHDSWDQMREAEYADMGVRAPKADQPELVSRLKRRGLPNTTIADTLGVTEGTVRNVIRNSTNDDQPETITNARGQERPTSYRRRDPEPEPEVIDAEIVEEEPEPAPSPVEAAESSASVQNARYLESFAAAMSKSDDFLRFDAERIGQIGDEHDVQSLELLARSTNEFLEKVKRARSGLRVINGGQS